jgi:predicted dehydrogenase
MRFPAPRTPDPRAAPVLRWGVIGTGWIAEHFVGAVQRNTEQRIVAVGSRDAGRSAVFAGRHEIERPYGSYADLAADADLDVVYVATPHTEHLACARLALEAGKHVLVEKPLGLDAEQAAEIAGLAAHRGLFCMEALWTFLLPRFDVVRQLLEAGAVGDVRTVLADCGERFDADHRVMRAEFDGGPLLDLGTYPVALAGWVLGEPEAILAVGQPHHAGVDAQIAAVLCHAGANQAIVHATILSDTPTSATIAGTDGTITLPGPFYQPGDVVLTSSTGKRQRVFTESGVAHDALYVTAVETARCMAAGHVESPLRPLETAIATLRSLDEIRRQCRARAEV